MSSQPSSRGSMRSSTQTSGCSKRAARGPARRSTPRRVEPGGLEMLHHAAAMSSSSSTIRTFAIASYDSRRCRYEAALRAAGRGRPGGGRRPARAGGRARPPPRRGEPGAGGRPRRRGPRRGLEPPGARGAGGRLEPAGVSRGARKRAARLPVEVPTRSRAAARSSSTSAPGRPRGLRGLRAGFTAAVSHEPHAARPPARPPGDRLASGRRPAELVEQARGEVDRIRELIDDVLFLRSSRAAAQWCRSARSGPARCSSRSWCARASAERAGVQRRWTARRVELPLRSGCWSRRREPRRERDPLRRRRRRLPHRVRDEGAAEC